MKHEHYDVAVNGSWTRLEDSVVRAVADGSADLTPASLVAANNVPPDVLLSLAAYQCHFVGGTWQSGGSLLPTSNPSPTLWSGSDVVFVKQKLSVSWKMLRCIRMLLRS